MYCDKCGNKIKDGDEYCSNCGSSTNKIKGVNSDTNVSIILAVVAIFTITIPFISIPCAIFAIIKGKKEKNGNTSIILGILSLIVSILITLIWIVIIMFGFFLVFDNDGLIDDLDKYLDKYGKKYEDKIEDFFDDGEKDFKRKEDEKAFDIKGHNWKASDGSVLLLKDNDSYVWYNDSRMDENNYSYGSYSVYNGYEAINYMINNFSDLGFSYDKQMKFFENDDYNINNYYILVLKCDKMIINGEDSNNKKDTYNYYGFYVNNSLKMIDISSGENNNFILNDRNGDDGTL